MTIERIQSHANEIIHRAIFNFTRSATREEVRTSAWAYVNEWRLLGEWPKIAEVLQERGWM